MIANVVHYVADIGVLIPNVSDLLVRNAIGKSVEHQCQLQLSAQIILVLIGLPQMGDLIGQLQVQGRVQIDNTHRAFQNAVQMRHPMGNAGHNIGTEIDNKAVVTAFIRGICTVQHKGTVNDHTGRIDRNTMDVVFNGHASAADEQKFIFHMGVHIRHRKPVGNCMFHM